MLDIDILDSERDTTKNNAIQDDALMFAQEIARNTSEKQLAIALASDQTESRFTEQAEYGISTALAIYHDEELRLQTTRDRIRIEPDDIFNVVDETSNDFAEVHRTFQRQYANTEAEFKKEAVSQSALRVRYQIQREPLLDTSSSVNINAGVFAGVEALVVAISYLGQTGAVTGGAAPALALAITGAANNIGLGGFLLGGFVLPACLSANSEKLTRWAARTAAFTLMAWLVFTNLLLSHYRVAGGDFNIALQNLVTQGIVFGDMIATLLFGFNTLMICFWAIKFFHSKDPIREYGRIGDRVREHETHLQWLQNTYPAKIRARADLAKQQMETLVSDAKNGVVLAKEALSKSHFAQQQFEGEQFRLIALLEDVVKFRRGIIQSLLREHFPIPAFYVGDVSFSYLAQPPGELLSAQSHIESVVQNERKMLVNFKEADATLEQLVANWQVQELTSRLEAKG